MPLAVILRRLFLLALLTAPQVYWLGHLWRLAPHQRPTRVLARLFVALAVLAIALVLYDRISTRILPAPVSSAIAPIVQLWIFSSTFAFLLVQLLHLILWIGTQLLRLFHRAPSPHNPTRRTFLHQSASIIGGMPFLAAIYGYSLERLHFEVVRVDVPIANLPPALAGLRIAQLSDIHVGDFMPPHEVRRAVDMANQLGPHLSVITGDFLSSRGDPLDACIRELSRLHAPLGVWGCNGNHEIYAAAEDEAEVLFRQHGMRLLRQSNAQLAWDGAQFNLIGIDYQRNVPFTSKVVKPNVDPARSLIRRDMPNILLSHNPDTFPSAAESGIELTLAGHTHGGQVNVEILHSSLNPARIITRFVAGLYRLPLSSPAATSSPQYACLYVNRGLGTLGVPARLGAYPEITLLTLHQA